MACAAETAKQTGSGQGYAWSATKKLTEILPVPCSAADNDALPTCLFFLKGEGVSKAQVADVYPRRAM